ncbi:MULTISPECIES: endonuclease MutS2 [unclassified Candidatus Frackibacter]|uniref:endonuclease MutS2 n=1 Tax=unclassified Candidatus Frackibacter TaxID=2648818 RepID=UPI000890FE3D|nr:MULTISPECIES: endonuclease MutS2 [unclassified Candidatus Frackibacter]SDC88616.1 DNA mismatch repair protein MutS2 [Candidatus Frackibacter sp. WG11]SEN02530.1 DNA mismatch repair protein MutS2 [Candidatus Frackibacter sp. WG12]SFM10579.1 DNA mismatch repair protein MutS2 [Candidatus Frackibacter sp. WG13]
MREHVLEILEYNKIKERLAKHTTSRLGHKLVVNLKPVSDLQYINQRQEEVTAAKKILNREGGVPLGGIRDITEALKKSSKEITLDGKELLDIANTLRAGRKLKRYLLGLEDEEDEYRTVMKHVVQIKKFQSLERTIQKAVDDQGRVMDSASSKLRNIRRKITNYSQRIKDKLNSILNSSKYKKFIQDFLVTVRDERYVIPIKSQFQSKVEGIVHDQSASRQTVFIEPMAVVKLNNELRSLRSKEEEEIYRILTELTSEVRKKLTGIKETLKLLAFLDFTFAKAKYSQEISGAEPLLNEEQNIKLEKARHPLIPQEEVVPISVQLGDRFNTLVITGPNTGGKTVTLKTVGLLTLMAQAGLHVPALSGSKLAVFDQVYGDIGDEQSIEQNLSTFSSHMTRIIEILRKAEKNTLVLIDEIGAGTDPTEGAALGMSILEELHNRDINTIATTHYSQLKAFAYQKDGIENASVEFNVETLRPTYRLQMGLPGRSNAFEIANRLGLDHDIIEQARNMLSEEQIQADEIIQDIEESKKSIVENEADIKKQKEEVEALKEEYKDKLAELKQLKKKIKKDAYKEAEEIIDEAKNKVDKVIKEVKTQTEIDRRQIDRAKSKLDRHSHQLDNRRTDIETELHEEELENAPKGLQEGEQVRIKDLNREGEVVEVLSNKEEVVVQAGPMKVNVDINRLERIDDDEINKSTKQVGKSASINRIRSKKSRRISPKLDLRGLRAMEAKEKTDKYLDDAYLAGISKAEIVHGKGTGVLREVVHDLLEEHPQVIDYRLGQEKEGGLGVTIVEF